MWGITSAHCFLAPAKLENNQVLWVSHHAEHIKFGTVIPANKHQTILGQAFDVLVFDARDGLDVNALAATLGTLRGGGVFILLTPPFENWACFNDPAYQRFIPYGFVPPKSSYFIQRFIRDLPDYFQPVQEHEHLPHITINSLLDSQWNWTQDQQQAINKIQNFQGISLLLADRGRGKSTLLGELLNIWSQQGKKVLVIAPKRSSTNSLFQQAKLASDCFIAPDDFLLSNAQADILIIDEAAAIPIPMLLQMLQNNKRVVFSTTIQGYEGSGRGFLLKFRQHLEKQHRNWQQIQLQTPVRWTENDQLEQWLNQTLLLDAEIPIIQSIQTIEYQSISQQELLDNEPLLQQVFGLLVVAHYQTRPSDLRQLLDATNLSIHILKQNSLVVAVALVSQEGGLDEAITEAIFQGKRRPQGHLVPQTLTCHAQIPQAAILTCERIMRIAVHPDCQQQGLGQQLLQMIEQVAQDQQVDYLATSYAATAELIRFWAKADYQVVRVGFKRDRASGAHAIVQIKGLSEKGKRLTQQGKKQFYSSLPALLNSQLADLETEIRTNLYSI